jgi:hypothetical protein
MSKLLELNNIIVIFPDRVNHATYFGLVDLESESSQRNFSALEYLLSYPCHKTSEMPLESLELSPPIDDTVVAE